MLPSLQVRVVQASVQDTSMCIFSFEESSFLPGGAAAPERLRFCCWIQVGRRRLRPGGCGCWATTQRGYHCCRSGCEDMLRRHVAFALFRLTPQVVRRAAAVACAARAALGLVAAGPRGVHNLCKTPAVFSLFSCVLYFPRHACSFWFWIVVARAAGHASTAVNLPFPSLLGHQVITPSGSAFAFGALWDSVLFNCAPSPEVHFVCRCVAFRVFCIASSLYSSLAYSCSGEQRFFLSLRRRKHLVSDVD